MKRIFLSFSILLSALPTLASPVCGNDTIVKVVRPDSIVVTETDSMTQVHVFGKSDDNNYRFNYAKGYTADATTTVDEHVSNWDFNVPFLKQKQGKKAKFSFNFMAFMHFGVAVPLDKTSDVKTDVGYHVGADVFNVAAALPSGRDQLSIGLGVECYGFKQHGGLQWVKQNGQLTSLPFPANVSHRRSWLVTEALTLPVHYLHEFKNTYFGVSVIPEWNILTRVQNHYRLDEHRINDKFSGLNRRKFDVAFRVEFGNSGWGGLYLQYNPFKTFTGSTGSNFKMITIGYTL